MVWQDPELLIELQKGVAIEATVTIKGTVDDHEYNDYASVYLKLPDPEPEE